MSRLGEETLVAYIKENQSAFYRLAFSIVKNSDDAMDAVQDAVLKAYEKRGTLRDCDTIKTWFYRILVNTSIDCLRRKKRLVYTDEPPEPVETVSQESRVLNAVDLYAALEKLPQELRTVVILRFFEDMKISDIAVVTGSTLSTAKNRLYRALHLLRLDMVEEERT